MIRKIDSNKFSLTILKVTTFSRIRQSSAVRHFGKEFKYFAEVNFERHKAIKTFFQGDIDVHMITQKISNYIKVPMIAGKTLLFFDEIQECPEAIMALRFSRKSILNFM